MSTVSVAPEVSARLFMFEPKMGGRSEAQLRFLRNLVNQVAPAVYNVYLLRRLGSRAAAVERARVARDLHDSVVQSLHAIAFRLYALRTQTTIDARERAQELLDLQQLVQKEAVNIRTLIQQLKPLDFDPRHLVDFLSGMVERYRYDTGIAAKFVCDLGDLTIPPHLCREVASIVQEALANVLKHSGAQNVLVRLGSQRGAWILTIDVSAIKAGSSNKEIALKLSISEETVKRHLSNIFGKLGVSSRLELAILASQRNLGMK